MARMPRRSTSPELAIRRELHRRGLRFRIDLAGVPGRPDIAFTRARVAVFVDGCFWHRCPEHGTMPRNNAKWWQAKFDRNVARDQAKDAALAALGWLVVHVWEHEAVADAADRIEAGWRRRVLEGAHGIAGPRRKPPFAKKRRTVEEPVEVAAGRLAQMHAGAARAAAAAAARVERAAVLRVHEGIQQSVQVGLEDGLQAAEHEVAAGARHRRRSPDAPARGTR